MRSRLGTCTHDLNDVRMEINAESLANQIPAYLTQDQKVVLATALKQWQRSFEYYFSKPEPGVLQGDAWTKVSIRKFDTGERAEVDAIVLSNTCDIDPDNKRHLPIRAIVAPLIPLENYMQALEREGVDAPSISQQIDAIRKQSSTNLFYLPVGSKLTRECIVRFDDVYSLPTKHLGDESLGSQRLLSLSMIGFYLFVFKLSVHFCRMHENVNRFETA